MFPNDSNNIGKNVVPTLKNSVVRRKIMFYLTMHSTHFDSKGPFSKTATANTRAILFN